MEMLVLRKSTVLKKFAAGALSLLLFCAAGCNNAPEANLSSEISSEPSQEVSSYEEPVKQTYRNPLTGLSGEKNITNNRPVAVMVNNIKVAQGVQCGLNDADIIYETEVEGGITRLMAVYQDVSSVERIGTVRSARYPYVDMAMGHDAVYIHCGSDPNYCRPHLKDLDHIDIDTGVCGSKRVSNGLASEHTLYAFGKSLWSGIEAKKIDTVKSNASDWVSFASEDESVSLSGGSCTSVSVAFSTSFKTGFTYDSASGLYTRLSNGIILKDYLSGEATQVKNVFVLLTDITDYPDGEHRKVALNSGKGYYITNGTYTEISWSKGNASSSFKFTGADGSALTVSAGDSWVCIADKDTSKPVIG